jgi:hypothetical protein
VSLRRAAPAAALLLTISGCTDTAGETRQTGGYHAPTTATLAVHSFDARVYGASGAVQLPDGRLVVAGDDEYNPLGILDIFGSGASKIFTPREIKRALGSAGTGALNDLEALTIDPRGRVYASTSHALTTKGVSKPAREQLVRFDIVRNSITGLRVSSRLKPALVRLDPVFAAAALAEPHAHGGLNIEGIAWDPNTSRLLIGFRSPRRDRDALVVWLENPDAVFDRDEEPRLLPATALDLDGEGVRDLTYSPTLQAFVIVAGTWRRGKHTPTTLWAWSGGTDGPRKLRTPDFDDLNPEGITEVTTAAGRALLIVSDDGNADELFSRGKSLQDHAIPSRYAIVPFGQLQRDGK